MSVATFWDSITQPISIFFSNPWYDKLADDINDLQSGYLFVKAKGLRIPSIYKLQYEKNEDGSIKYDKNGEAVIKYPEIWIEKGVLGFLASVTSQNSLDVDDEKEVVDVKVDEETGEVVEDEDISQAITDEPEDTEETNF